MYEVNVFINGAGYQPITTCESLEGARIEIENQQKQDEIFGDVFDYAIFDTKTRDIVEEWCDVLNC